jgi:catechol-2,3-dioxygenase
VLIAGAEDLGEWAFHSRPDFGLPGATFLATGNYYHIGLNTWHSQGAHRRNTRD